MFSFLSKVKKSKKIKPFSEEHKRKLSKVRKGKTYEEIYGKEKAEKIKRKKEKL